MSSILTVILLSLQILSGDSGHPRQPVHSPVTISDKNVFIREIYTLRREEDFRIASHLGFNAVNETGERAFPFADSYNFYVSEASWFTKSKPEETVLSEASTPLPGFCFSTPQE